jgi:hypothetical protein
MWFLTPSVIETTIFKPLLRRIRSRVQRPGIVFLDPDTGLEPAGSTGPQHVLDSEVESIWEALSPNDVMVFYQHQTNRNGTPWIKPKKLQLEQALKVRQGATKLAYAPKIARDVAFFFIEKKRQKTGAASSVVPA